MDIVGYDKYNTVYNRYDGLSGVPNEDAISSIFYQLVDLTDGKKMVAMSENDTIPSLENLTIEKAGWLYFCPWYGEYLMSEKNNYKDTLIELYQSDYVLTLDELPNLKGSGQIQTSQPVVTTVPPTTTAPVVTTVPPTTTAPVSGVKPVVKVTTNEGGSINQQYTITAAGTESVDLSKLAIRYYYDKDSTKAQTFWCDNAGLQLNAAPWYVNLSPDVIGTFYDGYLEITFDSSYNLTPETGSLVMGTRFAQSDWSSYPGFVGKDVVIYYDGAIVS